jgi:2-polyprenyl-6-methoxyphenol hydroxylase-like FAD-dependent oxidoreductase
MTRSAIVVGGGIGGLTTALALRRIGWQVTVFEKSALLGEVGAGLSLAPNALAALDAIGIGERIRALGRPSEADGTMMRPSGGYLMKGAPDRNNRLLAFHRADLHRALRDELPDDAIRAATTVHGVAARGDRVVVEHTGGSEGADLVVAADGIRSALRTEICPDSPAPGFRHYTAWRGIAELEGVTGSMTLAPGSYFLIHPLTGGRVYWGLGVGAEVSGVVFPDEHAEVLRRVEGWHAPIPELLAATPADAVLHNDIYDLDPLPTYVSGRAALLGDAAHAMCPDLGQGAGQAIEDAVVLAASLQDSAEIPAALARYDAQRRPRSQKIAKDARQRGAISVSPSRFTYRAMSLAMRLMPPAVAARASGRVWDWTPPMVTAADEGA